MHVDQLLASDQESLALIGLWIGVFLGDKKMAMLLLAHF